MAAENRHYAAWILLLRTSELHRFMPSEFMFYIKGRLFNNLSFHYNKGL